ncbi:hypothetical protein F5Y16DRAFT_327244 [Xylariaceae sp. FL0255]|nr:hypothetical protein F5Y16DRAFT_327244 [Xylariaceae sp. FL0255]
MAGAKSTKVTATTKAGTPFFTHEVPQWVKLWFLFSLPLIAWDSGYVFLRPLSMEGGPLHKPLWSPYKLYGEVDKIYGWKAFNENNGFTGSQSFMNVVESLMYIWYYYAWAKGAVDVKFADGKTRKVLVGRAAGIALLVGFTAAAMTVSKTALYWISEPFCNFDNIGHNDFWTLLILWIIPNGTWFVFPIGMLYQFGKELVDGLAVGAPSKIE